jgi:hypothetical protein
MYVDELFFRQRKNVILRMQLSSHMNDSQLQIRCSLFTTNLNKTNLSIYFCLTQKHMQLLLRHFLIILQTQKINRMKNLC